MKKNIITLTLGLMTVIGAGAQERRNWNFTHGWSDETLANIEQNITSGGDWTLESPGNYQIGNREAGPLTVNIDGTAWEIPETQGLQFGATSAKHIVIAYDNQLGYHGKQFLWINGSKDQDYFTIPKVAAGEKIFVVYESHNKEEERGFKTTTDGVFIDGTTDQTATSTISIDTAVFCVQEYYGVESVDVTFQATAGIHLYRICVGQELYDDEPVVEKDKVAYIYDSGFEGYDKAADMPLDLITYELPNRIENMELVEIDAAQADGSVTKDSLMAFEAVVVSGAMRKDNSMAQTVKEAVAYVPMVNLSPELYETWGYAKAVKTGMNTLYVDTTAAKSTLFEPSSASTRPYVDEDGNFSMFISGDGAAGYDAPQGSYFANDSVLAWAGCTPVIHVHNMERNAYIMVPYTYPMGEPDESFIDILPNAIKMVMQTKKAVVKTAKPTVTTTLKKLATEVKFDCSTPNTTYRYTTDGSDPATNGTAYTGPFLITEAGTIVKVVAQGDGYLPSDVVSSDPMEVKRPGGHARHQRGTGDRQEHRDNRVRNARGRDLLQLQRRGRPRGCRTLPRTDNNDAALYRLCLCHRRHRRAHPVGDRARGNAHQRQGSAQRHTEPLRRQRAGMEPQRRFVARILLLYGRLPILHRRSDRPGDGKDPRRTA